MSNSFHLALPAGNLEKTEKFYTEILECKTGNISVKKPTKQIESELMEMTNGYKVRKFFPWKLYYSNIFTGNK